MSATEDDGVIRSKTKLSLERRHQLIDLNKEYVNFEIFFECRAVDASKDFEMLVINQEQLNTVDLSNLAMKKTRGGYISGNIVADEDKYQNYFLVIRSLSEEEKVEVDLDIRIKPTEARSLPPPSSEETPLELPPVPAPTEVQSTTSSCGTWVGFFKKNYMMILFVVILLGVTGYFVYQRYYLPSLATATGAALITEDSSKDDAASEVSSSSSASSDDGKDLLQRLIKDKKDKKSEN
jgi:hypothetical protein